MFPERTLPRTHPPFRWPPSRGRRAVAERKAVATTATTASAGARTQTPHVLERVGFIALVLLAFGVRRPDDMDVNAAFLPADLIWVGATLLAFVGLIRERSRVLRLARAALPLIILLLFVGASLLWSNEPATTARRAIALFGTTAVAVYFMNRLGLRGFVEALALALAAAAAASAVLIAFVPSYGLQHGGLEYEGTWTGIFFEKNQLGQAMALGLVTLVALRDGARGVRLALMLACAFLFAGLLIGSESAGAIASTAVLAVTYPLFLWIRRTRSTTLALRTGCALGALALGAWLAGFNTDAVFGALGRDASLSGRTNVWEAVVAAIGERPVLGYGYREFWDPEGDARYFIHPNEDGWLADMAHNGFLEVALDTGLVGEAALFFFLAIAAGRASTAFWSGGDALSTWPLFAMLDIGIENLTDRSFATQDSIFWVVFVAAFWFVSEAAREQRAVVARAR